MVCKKELKMNLSGILIQSQSNHLGIGKLVEIIEEQEAVVEYFISVGNRLKQTMPVADLKRVALPRQTRCYLWLENEQIWQVGRIFERDKENKSYQVDIPNGQSVVAPETDVYVRCNLPIDDPIDILAMKGQETPYFYEQRSPFIRSLVKQRAVSHGITGLVSANIELYPHQVEIAKQVLEDPIQRYLLADEVGLGKTIEAGIILRQFLLDQPEGNALVIVPSYLLNQWQEELEEKFYLGDFKNRVQLLAIDDWRNISPNALVDLVIIDEAQNLAEMVSDSDTNPCFETIKSIAHKCDRLILLCATQILNQDKNLLIMLHFLDKNNYVLEDLKSFQEKLSHEQTISQLLFDFDENAKITILKKQIKKLKELFPEDTYLLEQIDNLETILKTKNADTEKEQLIKLIKNYLSQTHKLYPRILKTRRDTVEDVIFERNLKPQIEYDLDERSFDLKDLLEKWRTTAPKKREYQQIFLLLFEASSSWLGILKQLIEIRLNSLDKKEQKKAEKEWGKNNLEILTKTTIFAGESEILNEILNLINTDSEDGDKLELLNLILLYHLSDILELQGYRSKPERLLELIKQRIKRPFSSDKFPKLVIFTSFYQTGLELVKYLTNNFGKVAVSQHLTGDSRDETAANLQRFKIDPHCFLLILDKTGTQGLNLQFTDGVIHFDLPWCPNDLEQRLGRLDRVGSKINLKSWLLVGLEDSPQEALFSLLQDGWQIFNQSIAPLHSYTENKIDSLQKTLFESNLYGDEQDKLQKLIQEIGQEIEQEKIKINEQNILNVVNINEDTAHQYFSELENYDSNHKKIKKAVGGVLCDALQFRANTDVNRDEVYQYSYKISGRHQTLVPLDQLENYFVPILNQSGTYNRRIANQNKGIKLYRIGEKLIDTLAKYVSWDDRGQAFALWRYNENWEEINNNHWLGFRFDYIIETDLTQVQELVNKTKSISLNFEAIKRQADGLFLPHCQSIFLDINYQKVEDEKLLEILQIPYKGKAGDFNLAKNRLPILDRFIEPEQWPILCKQAREKSEDVLRQNPEFIKLCEQSIKLTQIKLATRINYLKLREQNLQNIKELKLENDLKDALIAGIKNPKIYLDSVGFIIISGEKPDM